jgi:hypothetical protein
MIKADQEKWTLMAWTNITKKIDLNADIMEVKDSNDIEAEVEEIILVRAAETNKPINLQKAWIMVVSGLNEN